ncbi:hypothetical protein B9479_000173 [Cryptococcus floricola]|uniref:Diphthamide biosynthesis protein 4 n=1 Tax=Cryptococcus floricola TaxID=2591691 RepID=A0A5D3B8M5_9TREE|nr:hypothetical protein B9479_000173 [Cryptococcus floricola]
MHHGLLMVHKQQPYRTADIAAIAILRIMKTDFLKIQYQQGIDYYAVLGLEEGASPAEVNKAWRKEVLLHHPDKNPSLVIPSSSTGVSGASTPSGSEEQNAKIHLINQARLVLTDPVLREDWLASFLSNAQQPQKPKEEGPHVFRHISLDEFEPCYASTTSGGTGEAEDEEEPTHFVHPCRCGGEFLITTEQLEQGVDVVGCEGCGEWVRVGYEVVEEED